jgi:glutamyl-tRNA(Gln) amidotransferase subunit D
MPGTKVRKLHASRRDTFKVVNSEPFAKISPDYIEPISEYNFRDKKKVKIDVKFEEKVALVKVYPGQDPNLLDYYLKNKYRGIVLELSGLGHAPTMRSRKGWTRKLKEVQKKGLIICATCQTIYGKLDPFVYSNGREILETGVIYLQDMLSETAFVKLGWVLGHNDWIKSKEKIKEKMLENFSHELNDRLEE